MRKPRRGTTGIWLSVFLSLTAAGSLHAQTAIASQAFYDDLGHLTTVIDPSGNAATYSYDAVGNILQVTQSTISLTALAILNITPLRTTPLATITIQGIGFSTTPSANQVLFNGAPGTVISATNTTLVVQVPANATSGLISVTVGGVTVTSSGNAAITIPPVTVLAVPTIVAITPKSVLAGIVTPNILVTGVNLTGATFSFGPAIAIGAVSVNSAGTSATMPLAVPASAVGYFTLVASNVNGFSSQTPVVGFLPGVPAYNTISVPGSNPNADPDNDGLTNAREIALGTDPLNPDTDGDTFADGIEVIFGSNPLDPKSIPAITQAASGAASSAAFSIQNTESPLSFFPPTQQESDSLLFSIANTTGTSSPGHVPVSPSGARRPATTGNTIDPGNTTLSTGALSPSIRIRYPRDGARLLAGQTVIVEATAAGGAPIEQVTLSVNGEPFLTDSAPPYELTFTVPAGVSNLSFSASATDSAGRVGLSPPITVQVAPDAMSTLQGTIVDSQGRGMKGAAVEPILNGLRAEFFHFQRPLSALPDLAERSPDVTRLVSAIDLRNPHFMFGSDPFGVGLGRDYAARFTGWLRIAEAGSYRFILGADEAARLLLNGIAVVDMTAGAGAFQEQSGTIVLEPGLIPIEVTGYVGVGSGEMQLSYVPPGGGRQTVTPEMLVADTRSFGAITAEDGSFAIAGVPGWVENLQAAATAKTDDGAWEGLSGALQAVPGGVTNAGTIAMEKRQ